MNHRYMRRAVLVSLLFHGALLLFFYLWHFRVPTRVEGNEITMSFISHLSPKPVPHIPAHPRMDRQPARIKTTLPAATTTEETMIIAAPQPADSLSGMTSTADSLARTFFPIPIPVVASTNPILPQVAMPQLGPLRGQPGVFPDRGAKAMSPNAGSTGPLFDVNTLLSQGLTKLAQKLSTPQPAPVRITAIPSVIEMAALCAIWEKGTPIESEIYSDLPKEIPITAEGLHTVLANLTAEGLLTSEIISPRLEFSFMTPVGSVPVEMSAKNRRNRVYRYTSRISAGEMMTFLQAARYQCIVRAPGDTLSQNMVHRHIQRILRTNPQ